MTKITDLKELRKIIRQRLISQSGVIANHVVYSQSKYGATIQKNPVEEGVLDTTKLDTIKDDDSFIVFDINNSLSTDDVVEETETAFNVYASFTSTVMFYGKNCSFNAIAVKARFLTEELIIDFQNNGIHIQEIDSKDQINEFINGRLVTRQDIVIHFSCEITVSKLVNAEKYNSASISSDWLHVE